MNMANQNMIGQNQTYNFNNQQGNFNLMGNSNKINVKQCKGILNVMGNGNQIVLCNSIFQANVNGNGNSFRVQGGELAIGINGNGNQINKVLPPRNDNPFWIDYGAKIRLMHVNGSYNIVPQNEEGLNSSIEADNNGGIRANIHNSRNNRNTKYNISIRDVMGNTNANNGGTHRKVNWGYNNNNNIRNNSNIGMYFNNSQGNQYDNYNQPQWPQERNGYWQNDFQPRRPNQYHQPQYHPFNPMNGFNPFNYNQPYQNYMPNQMPGQQQMPMPSQPFNPFQALLSSQNSQNMNNSNSIYENSNNRRILNQRENGRSGQIAELRQQPNRRRRNANNTSRNALNREDNISTVAVSGRTGRNRNSDRNRGRFQFYDSMLLSDFSDDEENQQLPIQRIRRIPNQRQNSRLNHNGNNRGTRYRFSFGQTVPGLTKSELNLLPRSKQSCKSGNCTICLQDMDVGSEVTFLICFHSFHSKCSLDWLERSATCPLCQLDIRPYLNQLKQ